MTMHSRSSWKYSAASAVILEVAMNRRYLLNVKLLPLACVIRYGELRVYLVKRLPVFVR